MKMAKCDLCGDIQEADMMSAIIYTPSESEDYTPRYKYEDENGEHKYMANNEQFDVCCRCAAKIFRSLTKRNMCIPNIALRENGDAS